MTRMRTLLAALGLASALALAAPLARAVDEPAIPDYAGFVNDRAALMPEEDRAKLEAFLDQVKQKTGAELAVLTVPTTAPLDPAEYKVRVFEKWKIGKKGEDTGLLLLVAVQEHKIWFETGYGLEGTLPDGLEARIIREEATPRFRAGDYAGGITATMLRAAARIAAEKGVALEWNGAELRYDESRPERGLSPAAIAFLITALVILLIVRGAFGGWGGPRRGAWMMGGLGGLGGWGGGFGGGGGGGGFGGFGGGGSGGGGGGGGW
jgi:uncharacterized protein